MRTVQRELRRKIRKEKCSYRKKMEDQLLQINVSGVWRGVKTTSGHKNAKTELKRDQEWVDT